MANVDKLEASLIYPREVKLIEFRIIYLQGKEVGVLPEGHHQSGSAAHPLERATSMDA